MSSVASRRLWPAALIGAGALLLAAGPLHPDPDPTMSFEQSTARMLGDPTWGISHSLMLTSFVLMLIGLVGLAQSGVVRGRVRGLTWIAVAGAALSVVEMTFHLAASSNLDALRTGGPTPILNIHLFLALFAYPALGVPLALLAWLGSRTRELTHPLLGFIGFVGAVAHGFAAPIVVTTRDQDFSMLFKGVVLMAIWLVAVGVGRLRTATRTEPARA